MDPLTRVRVHLRSLPPRQRAVVILCALFSSALGLTLTHLLSAPAGLVLDAAAALALVSAFILSLSQQPPAIRRWLALGVGAVFVLACGTGVVASTLSLHPHP